MELRHLETLMAIDEQGSFTAAADALSTVQSNVSEQIRQLERELGAELLVRNRRGAVPTECGEVVLARARRIRREIEGLRDDLAAVRGLETGEAGLGIVGTASRWLVPQLVGELRAGAPGVRLRISEAASERLFVEVLDHEVAQAVVTEPVLDPGLAVEHLMEEALVGIVPLDAELPEPVTIADLARLPVIMPVAGNPLRHEIEQAAAAQGVDLRVQLEIEGIRLITDLVATGWGASILPETAVVADRDAVRVVDITGLPPRRLALISARDGRISLADSAVREAVLGIVAARVGAISTARRGVGQPDAAPTGTRPARVTRRPTT